MRPAEVIGSWATTQPAGAHGARHHAHDRERLEHVEQQEAAERQVDLLGEGEVLAGLGERDHLRVGRRGACDLVARQRVAVDGVDAAVAADHLGQRHRHVAAAGAHVDTAPARPEPEAQQRRGQGAPVDVVAQPLELTHARPAAPDGSTMAPHSTVLADAGSCRTAGATRATQRRGDGPVESSMTTSGAIRAGHHSAMWCTLRSPNTMVATRAALQRPNRSRLRRSESSRHSAGTGQR